VPSASDKKRFCSLFQATHARIAALRYRLHFMPITLDRFQKVEKQYCEMGKHFALPAI
jgi:hypothetical protein